MFRRLDTVKVDIIIVYSLKNFSLDELQSRRFGRYNSPHHLDAFHIRYGHFYEWLLNVPPEATTGSVCTKHYEGQVTKWDDDKKQQFTLRGHKLFCQMSDYFADNKHVTKIQSDRFITREQSKILLEKKGVLIPIGTRKKFIRLF